MTLNEYIAIILNTPHQFHQANSSHCTIAVICNKNSLSIELDFLKLSQN